MVTRTNTGTGFRAELVGLNKTSINMKSKFKMAVDSRRTARVEVITLVVGFLVIFPLLTFSQQGWGQVTLQNNCRSTADLWVDGNYGCRALGHGGSCTTQVRVGFHKLKAVATDGRSFLDSVDMPQGKVYTLTVWDEPRR